MPSFAPAFAVARVPAWWSRGEARPRCNNRVVAYNRRQQRRQGIVYGPPRGRERYSDNGVLIGRFLGLGILLLTLGVLAAGALAFVGDRSGPSSTPGRSSGVGASGSPSAASSAPSPAATPTIAPPFGTPAPWSPVPSVVPTAVAPLVQVGAGYVTFGTHIDDQLHITDPRATFSLDERIVWSAYLTEPADAVDLHIQIVKKDSAAVGGERLILDEAVTPLVRNAQVLQLRLKPRLLDGPGIYIVRYLKGTDALAEGGVQITA